MFKRIFCLFFILGLAVLTGCASVPMESSAKDGIRKQFSPPAKDSAGIYIYRNSNFGAALKKTVSIDGVVIGETAPKSYFYQEVEPGSHIISTESEFGDNQLTLNAKGGKNYFINQYIKMGVFVGGANLKLVSNGEGRKGVLECKLAKSAVKSTLPTAKEKEGSSNSQATKPQKSTDTAGEVKSSVEASVEGASGKNQFQAEKLSLKHGCDRNVSLTSSKLRQETYLASNCEHGASLTINCEWNNCIVEL